MDVTHRLNEETFNATFEDGMTNVTEHSDAQVDIWPYVRAVEQEIDLPQEVLNECTVESVYRSSSGRYDHVLIPSYVRDIYLVLVVDRFHSAVFGHHILDLNKLYELSKEG